MQAVVPQGFRLHRGWSSCAPRMLVCLLDWHVAQEKAQVPAKKAGSKTPQASLLPLYRANNISIMLIQFGSMGLDTVCSAVANGDPDGTVCLECIREGRIETCAHFHETGYFFHAPHNKENGCHDPHCRFAHPLEV